MSPRQQVRVLTLELDRDGTSIVYKLQKDWILQFRLGPSLLGQRVNLFTNHPVGGKAFDRKSYARLEWDSDSSNKADDTSIFTDVKLHISGSFHFYIENESGKQCGQGYFLVEPTLTFGKDNEFLPMDCIQCQTVLTKNLGQISTWEDKLAVARETGYNMIHFTPVQVLGNSDSAYCLAGQHDLDPRYKGGMKELDAVVKKMRDEWNVLSICDIVLNHTANESDWIRAHPECSYNVNNSKHLRPAFLLDRVLYQVTLDIAEGVLEKDGIPKNTLATPHHIDTVERLIHERYLPPLRFEEFFLVDVDKVVQEVEAHQLQQCNDDKNNKEELEIILDPERKRWGSTVDLDVAKRLHPNSDDLRRRLEELNRRAREATADHLRSAVTNVLNGAKYERLDSKGPKLKECNPRSPLICQYFTCPEKSHDLKDLEAKMYTSAGDFYMAHNGWVMGMDPSVNFASDKSMVYFRRELVAWGDSVKLNFGSCPEDNPFLWQYMQEYVEQTARVFHGIRLDNCHSTPVHVAEYLLDAARRVQPELYVIAELFTGSEATDNKYLNRLGINSLIREGLRAWDSHELGRLVYHYGGAVVGGFAQPDVQPLQACRVAHAILFDQTHDNQSAIEVRTPEDVLPSSALCQMACCAFGSNRGHDEMVPHHIHVVKECREYAPWRGQFNGMMEAKRALNDLHFRLGKDGFAEVYVDQMDTDIVAVTRHNPVTHQTVVLIAHTAFNSGVDLNRGWTGKWLNVEGQLMEVEIEANLHKIKEGEFVKDDKVINCLENYVVDMRTHVGINEAKFVKMHSAEGDPTTRIELCNLKPGSVIAFRFQLNGEQRSACASLQSVMSDSKDLQAIINRLSLADLNHVLFKSDQEERDDTQGQGGVYTLDGYGPLKYAGLQGVMSILAEIRPIDDLGNWLPTNLRNGDWMLDYIIARLKRNPRTADLGGWFEAKAFKYMRSVPRYLIPRYFDSVISSVYCLLLDQIWASMSDSIRTGSGFVRALAMGSVQHGAVIRSAPLPPTIGITEQMVSLAAGLPHFSTGYMRNWGRDTFISLRGLFILTGRFDEAKNIILAFGACLRHGLIPNLLDGGFNSRFNCRDAIWWWLNCIKSYVTDVPDGDLILKDPVSRIFPTDDAEPHQLGQCVQPLEDVIQEALQKHFQGLKFRERNAGKRIDEHMLDEGFNNEIGVDLKTGFVFGGNIHNCGTWMDKMGSSLEAQNKGRPATPRDGSAVELVGLSYSSIKWLSTMNAQGLYKYRTVVKKHDDGKVTEWTLKEWANRIEANFEQNFFVVRNNPVDKRPDLINKTLIYKDTLNSGHPWTDYQLRCNFPITMTVASELFDPEHAWAALQIARVKLLGPLGMATLDPDDWAYRPYYDNSNQSNDQAVAHGYNYHQGPEWVWPVGYFLRAYLHFGKVLGKQKEVQAFAMSVMSAHYTHVQQSHWRGIPELTNKKGDDCPHSNPIQAWSMACLLEVLNDIEQTDE